MIFFLQTSAWGQNETSVTKTDETPMIVETSTAGEKDERSTDAEPPVLRTTDDRETEPATEVQVKLFC